MHISFSWDNKTLNRRHSDYILSMGWVRHGWDVYYFDYRKESVLQGNRQMNQSIIYCVDKYKPDILFISKPQGGVYKQGGRNLSGNLSPHILSNIRENGYKGTIIHWYLDQRKGIYEKSANLARHCDWFFYCAAGYKLKEYYDYVKVPTSFVIAPYEPSFTRPIPYENRTLNLLWMGGDHRQSKFEQERYNILKELIDKKILKNYFGCFGKNKVWCPQYNKLIGSTKILLSLYAFNYPMYFSNRLSHCIGSGTTIASYDFLDRNKILPDDSGIFFTTAKEFIEKYKYYHNRIDDLKNMATKAKIISDKYFTSYKVVEDILYTLKNGKSSLPFGETINPERKTFNIPDDKKEIGKVYYVDGYSDITSIYEYKFNDNCNISCNISCNTDISSEFKRLDSKPKRKTNPFHNRNRIRRPNIL